MYTLPMGVYSIHTCTSSYGTLLDQSAHFNKLSGGSPTMNEEDFARILLRHTTWELEPVFSRLREGERPIGKVWTCSGGQSFSLGSGFHVLLT